MTIKTIDARRTRIQQLRDEADRLEAETYPRIVVGDGDGFCVFRADQGDNEVRFPLGYCSRSVLAQACREYLRQYDGGEGGGGETETAGDAAYAWSVAAEILDVALEMERVVDHYTGNGANVGLAALTTIVKEKISKDGAE